MPSSRGLPYWFPPDFAADDELWEALSGDLGDETEQYAGTGEGIELGFDPAEKRDFRGRWTRGGAAHYAAPDPDRLVLPFRRGKLYYRTPADHPFFKAHPVSSAHIVSAYDQASDQEKAQGMRWYADVHNLAAKLDHGDIEMNAGVIAALSPQSDWPVNILNADRSLDEGRALGPGEGMITTDMQSAATRAMSGMKADAANHSPKTRSFARLIRTGGDEPGDTLGDVAVDRHALTVAMGVRLPKKEADPAPIGKERYYQHVADQYRLAALEVSKRGTPVTPYQIQAVTWLRQQRINEAEDLAHDTISADATSSRGGRRLAKGRSVMLRNSWERWMAEARQHRYPLVPGVTAINATEQFASDLLGIELGFNEHELRDRRGRWTSSSAEGRAVAEAAGHRSFSVSVRSGQEPAHGYMVAQTGHTHTYPATVLDDPQEAARAIDDMLMSEREAFEGTDTYLGGWVHGGKLWLEPSDNIASRDEAVRAAASRNQIAIWDVDSGAEIETGGAGGTRVTEHAEGADGDPAELLGLARSRAPGGSGGAGSPAPGGLAAQFLDLGFNPHELRDRRGRWTRGGSSFMEEARDGFTGRQVMFMDKGKRLTGTVVSFTPAGPGNRYDTLVIEGDLGRYTRHASTVKLLPDKTEKETADPTPAEDTSSLAGMADELFMGPITGDAEKLHAVTLDDVALAAGRLPGLLHSKNEEWNGKITLFPREGNGGIQAGLDWDGTMYVADNVAQGLADIRDYPDQPVGNPPVFEVLEHELIHGVVPPGTGPANMKAFQESYAVGQIEEGFTELGAIHHAPGFLREMGVYDRDIPEFHSPSGLPVGTGTVHYTMGEMAEDIARPSNIAQGLTYGHYAPQTKDAQDWVQLVAKEEGHAGYGHLATRGHERVVALTDEINRMGAAGKVPEMARQLAVAMTKGSPHRNDRDYMADLTETIRQSILDQWSVGQVRDTYAVAKSAATRKMHELEAAG